MWSLNPKSANWQICRNSANLKNYIRKFADMQFAELICGPPPLWYSWWYICHVDHREGTTFISIPVYNENIHRRSISEVAIIAELAEVMGREPIQTPVKSVASFTILFCEPSIKLCGLAIKHIYFSYCLCKEYCTLFVTPVSTDNICVNGNISRQHSVVQF